MFLTFPLNYGKKFSRSQNGTTKVVKTEKEDDFTSLPLGAVINGLKEFSIACGYQNNTVFRSCSINFCPRLSENIHFVNF